MNAEFDITGLVLSSPRLILRAWNQDDLEDFYEYAKVDEVGHMAGFPPHGSIEESLDILNRFIEGKKTFAIWHKQDHKVIGSVGIERYDECHEEFASLKGRELGYALSKEYWGQGLMPEALNAVIEYLFNILEYDFLLSGHFLFNKQSARVQEKCGFVPYRKTLYETKAGTKEEIELELLRNPSKSRTNVN